MRKPRPRPDINIVSQTGNYEYMTSLPQLEDSCCRLLFSSSNLILIIVIITTTSIWVTTFYLPTNIFNMASSSQSKKLIEQSRVCSESHKYGKTGIIETCYWGINDGVMGREENDCKHPVVRLIDPCKTMDGELKTYCRKTKRTVDEMHAYLVTAKKALKVYAFYHWVEGKVGAVEDEDTRRSVMKIRDNVKFNSENTSMRGDHSEYFKGVAENKLESIYKKFVRDYEGENNENDRLKGAIAKALNDRMIQKAVSRNIGWAQDIEIDYYSRPVPGPCHPIYCPAIPIDKLSAAAKIDLAGGSIIPGIEWAFEEPTA